MLEEETKEEKIELLQVRTDTIFHDLFCREDMDTLEWAVSKILDCKYEDIHGKVKVANIRLSRLYKKERTKYLDLLVEYKNEKIIIEMNNNTGGIHTRNILYACNVLVNNYRIKEKKDLEDDYYKKVIKVVLVNLNWFRGKLGEKIEPKKVYEIPYSDLTDDYIFKMINANLDYYSNICYDDVNQADKLYKLLTITRKEDLKKIMESEKLLDTYGNKLMKLSKNSDYTEVIMDEIVEQNVAKQTAYLIGKNEGIEQGIEQKQVQIILNMYEKKMKLSDIASFTDLSIQEVEKIIDNNK
ncbi:MAG: hypothetical protein IJ501_04295 [Bacilli bacterium]|nr:hypothetical protein [Bacilli bacterium]